MRVGKIRARWYPEINRSARLDSGRERAGSLLKRGGHPLAKPLKSATTSAQQVALLRARGMQVDEALAAQWLSNVSYYRLSAYWYPARRFAPDGGRADDFYAGTSFAEVVALYEADRKLRTLVHDGMERVEVTMRARVGEWLCADGPLSYADPSRFRPSFDHAGWMSTADKRIHRAGKHNEAIKHYRREYGGRYPFWVLAEVLDFADISRLFEGLRTQDQRPIAEGLGITIDLTKLSSSQQRKATNRSPLTRWLEQLTVIRNTCAHHGRLWNKSFAPASTAALRTHRKFEALPKGQSERVFGALVVMASILRVVSPGTNWPEKVSELLATSFLPNGLVTGSALGLPDGWDGSL